jgi:UDP-glucose 6-dehydrogenase
MGKLRLDSPCLPKDLSALISSLEKVGFKSEFLKIVEKTGVEGKTNGKSK